MYTITLTLLVITVALSLFGFGNKKVINDFIFYPPAIKRDNEWWRFITNGFIHADLGHLAFNMFSLYMFGEFVEKYFIVLFNEKGKALYLAMYLTALVVCLIPTYIMQRNNNHYRSLGASGAVSAVVFAGVFLDPTIKIGLFIIPPIIPGFIFGPLYLLMTIYMSKRGGDNINHSAHFWGSVWGVGFLIIACKIFPGFDPIQNFVSQVSAYLHL
jgi:membrane associated rhomboid family serine protease